MVREKPVTIIQFITKVLVIFSFVMLFMSIIGPIIGDEAQGVSTLFILGSQGVSYTSIYQALCLSLYTNIVQVIFLSGFLEKRMQLLWRTVLMFASVFIGCGVLSVLFGWFPADNLLAWILYLLCFVVMAGISSAVMIVKNKLENAKVNQKLAEYKQAQQSINKEE